VMQDCTAGCLANNSHLAMPASNWDWPVNRPVMMGCNWDSTVNRLARPVSRHLSRPVARSWVMMDYKSDYTSGSMASMPDWMGCNSATLASMMATLDCSWDSSDYMMAKLASNLAMLANSRHHHMARRPFPSCQNWPMASLVSNWDWLDCTRVMSANNSVMLASSLVTSGCTMVMSVSNLAMSANNSDLLDCTMATLASNSAMWVSRMATSGCTMVMLANSSAMSASRH